MYMDSLVLYILNGGAMSWKSSQQEITVDLIIDVEYVAACDAAKEAIWIWKFLSMVDVVLAILSPVPLYCDNYGAIAHANDPRSHQRSKHIKRQFLLI